MAKIHHPDHSGNKSDSKFKEIGEAYEILSDPQKRKDYDSARNFGNFTRDFGSKFTSGQWDSRNFSSPFANMSFEEQQMVTQHFRRLFIRAGLILLGLFAIWSLITRKPNRFYEVVNGQLIPIDPRMMNGMNPFVNNPIPQYQQQHYGPQFGGQQYPPMGQYPGHAGMNNYGSPYNYTPVQPAYGQQMEFAPPQNYGTMGNPR